MDAKKYFTMASLFCGAGGMDMGFENHGIRTLWANDIDNDACETHRLWSHAEVLCGDIGGVDFQRIPDVDAICGGFPCQGFSLAGPRKLNDKRNVIYPFLVKNVKKKRPKIIVAENVKGLLTMGDGEIIRAIVDDFAEKGYTVTYNLVNSADYGVAQDRMRVIIVGIRDDLEQVFTMPAPFKNRTTMKEALKGVDLPKEDEVCNAPYSSRYMSRNRKRGWDKQSFTIPAMAKQVPLWPGSPDMVKYGPNNWVFGEEEITRRLSYKEAAAIQTFPKDMVFCGDLTSKYKQIGNAVPVKLAEVVAGEVRNILEAAG